MFRKSIFIMVFVCLLAAISPVAMAAYPWDGQLEWNASAGDANWYNPANWNNQGTPVCPTDGSGPSWNNYTAVLPNQPGPRITGNATTSMLNMNAWDPTSWGGQDCNIIIDANAGDVNMGAAIQINSWVDYDSYLGTPTLVSRAILNVYGGTVTAPSPTNATNMCGVRIGGGGSGFGLSYGMLNIYGGLVRVPKVELNFGEIGLYGGTLQVTTEPNLTISTTHPEATLNKIKINGGTLILAGDRAADINAFVAIGKIVCERGTLKAPVYDIGPNTTTLTADVNYCVWNPQPALAATNIHYKSAADVCSITLSWRPSTFEDIDVNHDVYFGTSSNLVNTATKLSAEYKGTRYDFPHYGLDANGDPCSWTISDYNFVVGRTYYWRVDEINDANIVKKGIIWRFTAHNGNAYNPKPATDSNGLNASLQLSWTAGDWADSHRVYFSTTSPVSTVMTDPLVYRGTQSGTTYSLKNLVPDYTLTPGTTYYWRIVEVNTTTNVAIANSVTWTFKPTAYINIDDFEDSTSTDDVNTNWPTPYYPTGNAPPLEYSCGTSLTGDAARILTRDSAGKYLRYKYTNGGGGARLFSEARRVYPGGTSFTGGGVISPAPRALRVDYRGTAINGNDRMYIAIEDTAGNVSIYNNPDANAAMVGNWTSWYSSLYDINAVGNTNLQAISGFAIGFGVRCQDWMTGGDGNVMFDNIRLYASTCVPQFGPTADLDEDCDVDINDMDRLATDWLQRAQEFNLDINVPAAPVLWYKFSESGEDVPLDSGTGDANNYTGTITNFITQNWKVGGGRDGNNCLYLPPGGGCYVEAPVTALGFMGNATHTAPFDGNTSPGGGGISFSVWINADMTAANMLTSWNGLFGTWNGAVSSETLEIHCPSPTVPPACNFIKRSRGPTDATAGSGGRPSGDFGGRWNHYAFVKEPNSMKLYINGSMVSYVDANLLPNDPNAGAYGPLFDPNVGAFRIGTRGGNWGNWNGYIQDFKVFDYTLSPSQVSYLATDGSGYVFLPLVSSANVKNDGTPTSQIVNFGDLAVMGQQWHTEILWP